MVFTVSLELPLSLDIKTSRTEPFNGNNGKKKDPILLLSGLKRPILPELSTYLVKDIACMSRLVVSLALLLSLDHPKTSWASFFFRGVDSSLKPG